MRRLSCCADSSHLPERDDELVIVVIVLVVLSMLDAGIFRPDFAG